MDRQVLTLIRMWLKRRWSKRMTKAERPPLAASRARRKLEGRFKLTINREKTRVVHLEQPTASLDFLGFTFRDDCDLYGRDRRDSERVPLGQSAGTAAREDAASDRQRPLLPTDHGSDRGSQPAAAGLVAVLLAWLSARGVSPGQLVRAKPLVAAPASSEVSVPSARRKACRRPLSRNAGPASVAAAPSPALNPPRPTPLRCLG